MHELWLNQRLQLINSGMITHKTGGFTQRVQVSHYKVKLETHNMEVVPVRLWKVQEDKPRRGGSQTHTPAAIYAK
jgi:hypothetical protein